MLQLPPSATLNVNYNNNKLFLFWRKTSYIGRKLSVSKVKRWPPTPTLSIFAVHEKLNIFHSIRKIPKQKEKMARKNNLTNFKFPRSFDQSEFVRCKPENQLLSDPPRKVQVALNLCIQAAQITDNILIQERKPGRYSVITHLEIFKYSRSNLDLFYRDQSLNRFGMISGHIINVILIQNVPKTCNRSNDIKDR